MSPVVKYEAKTEDDDGYLVEIQSGTPFRLSDHPETAAAFASMCGIDTERYVAVPAEFRVTLNTPLTAKVGVDGEAGPLDFGVYGKIASPTQCQDPGSANSFFVAWTLNSGQSGVAHRWFLVKSVTVDNPTGALDSFMLTLSAYHASAIEGTRECPDSPPLIDVTLTGRCS